ncbi:MAG: hypothetical protein AAFV93_05340 [Chloroflexota bacterium]
MTIHISHLQANRVLVNVSSTNLSWQDWHYLITDIVQYAVDKQHPITLVLFFDDNTNIIDIMGETIDYLLQPELFDEVYFSSFETIYDGLILSAIDLLNAKARVKWHYIPTKALTLF